MLVTGPTGVGKTFLACALAQAAIRRGHTALYLRLPRLLDELVLARADGRLPRAPHDFVMCRPFDEHRLAAAVARSRLMWAMSALRQRGGARTTMLVTVRAAGMMATMPPSEYWGRQSDDRA